MNTLSEGEIAREARRILRRLAMPGAHLRPDGPQTFRILSREDSDKYRNAEVSTALVEAFARRGWIVRAGSASTYVLSDAGQGWFERATAEADPFAAQHQLRRPKILKDARGRERRVVLDEGESPLARLKSRGLIDASQFEAGEKLRRDFTLAQLMPRLGVDLTAPIVLGTRGKKPDRLLTDMVIAAKQRFANAMRAVGPGLGDLLFDVCCHLRGLEEAERAFGWPNRAGRVVLAIGLDRLAEHYGLHITGRARMRAWQMEEES
jgi:hypothetical protein